MMSMDVERDAVSSPSDDELGSSTSRVVESGMPEIGYRCASEPQHGALDMLIAHLLGQDASAEADVGLAGFGHDRLRGTEEAASRESVDCLDRLRCLLDLFHANIAAGARGLTSESLLRVSHHMLRAMEDHRRWRLLAGNALLYREDEELARRMAGELRWMKYAG